MNPSVKYDVDVLRMKNKKSMMKNLVFLRRNHVV